MSLIAQTTYYVSSSRGKDTNPGTSESQAWKTLTKVNSFKPKPGDHILFKSGDSWEGTLTPTASGSAGNQIVYGAYGVGAKPKIYGSTEITGWTKYKGNIYQATVSRTVKQLFIDGTRLNVARYPNTGYAYPTTVNSTTEFTSTSLNSGINYTGATCFYRGLAYKFSISTVRASSSQTIVLSAEPSHGITTNKGFILVNDLDLLDSAGEWYYDKSSSIVYLWTPDSSDPSMHTVTGSVLDNGITVDGYNYLTFENLNLQHQAVRGFNGADGTYIIVDNCDFDFPNECGIEIGGSTHSNYTVTNNTITGANRVGIQNTSIYATISNNTITDTGLLENIGVGNVGVGTGISSTGHDNTITYNKVINSGYNGISFGAALDNVVSYNYIDSACTVLDDGGGIYTYTGSHTDPASSGSVISHNIVKNCIGQKIGIRTKGDMGYGIYLDGASHDITVSNNTVVHCSGGIFTNAATANIKIDRNTVMDAALLLQIEANTYPNTITNNIIYATDRLADFTWWTNSNQRLVRSAAVSFHTFDHNTYVSHYSSTNILLFNPSNVDFATWQSSVGGSTNCTLDTTSLSNGETEELYYNATKQTKTINLGTSVYRDLDGKQVTGSITLAPFTSKILIQTTLTNTSGDNQTPIIQDQSFDIIQDQAVNDVIGQIVASDPDAGQTLSYSIAQGNDANLFSIDPTTGAISANTTILANIDQSYALIIRVTDDTSSPLSAEAQVTITIKNTFVPVDTTLPIIASFEIPATSSSLEVLIASFAATDKSGVAGYQLTESAIAPLSTDAGWSSTAPSTYTFAQEGTKTLYAWAKDSAGNVANPQSASVTITLPDLSPTSSEYKFEETSGTTVIDSKGSNNGTIVNSASRVTGAIKQGLEFTKSGYITVGQAFGENVQQAVTLAAWLKPTLKTSGYQGIIMHGGPNVDTYALYIYPDAKRIAFKTSGTSSSWFYIDNVNKLWDGNWHQIVVTYDGAQKIIYLDNTALATVSATGAIDSGQGYHLMIGAGRDEATPNLLYQGSIDEVSIYNYALTVSEVSDLYQYHLGSESAAATVNQSPLIQDQSFQITEPLAKNDFIAQVLANDPDPGSTLSYVLTQGNKTGLFAIDPMSGVITANTDISTTTAQSYVLSVQVTDNATNPLSASAEITVNVVHSNQSPVIPDQSFNITQNKNADEVIGQVTASDPNSGQTLTFSITQGNDAGLFAIDPSTGTITANSAIQTTTDQTYVLTVNVVDSDVNPLSEAANITINIIHTNLNPVIQNQAFDITKDKNTDDFIGQVLASDPNDGQSLTFSITQGNNLGLFAIDPSTGTITAKSAIQTTEDQAYTLTVNVADNDTNPLSANAQVTVHIIGNKQNQSPVISDQIFQIRKNDQVGDTVGTVVASDPDTGQILSYSITSGNDQNLFAIDALSGEISVNNTIDVTASTSFTFAVQVTDNALLPLNSSANITINVTINGKISQAVVKNSKKNQIILSSTKPLQTSTLKSTALVSSFILNDDRKVTKVTIRGSEIYLDVDSEYQYGDEIEVSYVKGSTLITDLSGNEIESFSNLPVDNMIENDASVTTGIDQENEIIKASVYPNPINNGAFTIKINNVKSPSCQLLIYDLTGKQVMIEELSTDFGNLEKNINVSHLSKGTYIVRLVSDVELYHSKIIII